MIASASGHPSLDRDYESLLAILATDLDSKALNETLTQLPDTWNRTSKMRNCRWIGHAYPAAVEHKADRRDFLAKARSLIDGSVNSGPSSRALAAFIKAKIDYHIKREDAQLR